MDNGRGFRQPIERAWLSFRVGGIELYNVFTAFQCFCVKKLKKNRTIKTHIRSCYYYHYALYQHDHIPWMFFYACSKNGMVLFLMDCHSSSDMYNCCLHPPLILQYCQWRLSAIQGLRHAQ